LRQIKVAIAALIYRTPAAFNDSVAYPVMPASKMSTDEYLFPLNVLAAAAIRAPGRRRQRLRVGRNRPPQYRYLRYQLLT
jgi:hypothetical protein